MKSAFLKIIFKQYFRFTNHLTCIATKPFHVYLPLFQNRNIKIIEWKYLRLNQVKITAEK